jgi:hypothetical protein
MTLYLLLLIAVVGVTSALRGESRHARMPRRTAFSTKLPYNTATFPQVLDHFNYQTPAGARTMFAQRVLYNLDYWQKGANASACPGPIFFYTGNESPGVILVFCCFFFNSTNTHTHTFL